MKYESTRKKSPSTNASHAIQQGLAPDGGLYIPESWPDFSEIPTQEKLADLNFAEFSAEILKPFFEGDPLQKKLLNICTQAFNFPLKLKGLDDSTSILELYHGPTNAFKDFGARFLALTMNEFPPSSSGKQKLVLVATSGDTGSAVAAAFSQCTKIPVAILYPKGMISPRQEMQLTIWGKQGKAFAVNGTFDDCQGMVKKSFLSDNLKSKFDLISANSINLARLLPQMCYFAFISLQHQKSTKTEAGFIVPSGNLGNSVAALWAQKIGFPIKKVILAQNANTAVANYFVTENWKSLPTVQTLANAMDVGNPSNFERLMALYDDPTVLKSKAAAFSINDDEIRQYIKKAKSEYNEIICPHTATAFCVREKLKESECEFKIKSEWIIVSTAHPAKFEEIVEPLIGEKIDVPENLKSILDQPGYSQSISSDQNKFEDILTSIVQN
jgi:threonine synthase